MTVTIITNRDRNKQLKVEILESWLNYDSMEELAEYITSTYGAKITKKVDGPDTRHWLLNIGGYIFQINFFDNTGFEITVENPEGEKILRRIGEDLKSNIGNV